MSVGSILQAVEEGVCDSDTLTFSKQLLEVCRLGSRLNLRAFHGVGEMNGYLRVQLQVFRELFSGVLVAVRKAVCLGDARGHQKILAVRAQGLQHPVGLTEAARGVDDCREVV